MRAYGASFPILIEELEKARGIIDKVEIDISAAENLPERSRRELNKFLTNGLVSIKASINELKSLKVATEVKPEGEKDDNTSKEC